MAERDQPTLFNTVNVVVACVPRLGWRQRLWLAGRLLMHSVWVLVWWAGAVMAAFMASVMAAALGGAVGIGVSGLGRVAQLVLAGVCGLGALLWMLGHGQQRTVRWRSRLVMALRHRVVARGAASTGGSQASVAVGTTMPSVALLAYPVRHGHTTLAAVAVVVGALLCGLSVGVVHAQRRFHCRARVAEAKTALKTIYVTELAYKDEFGTWLGLEDLVEKGGLQPRMLANMRFYAVTGTADKNGFRFEAEDTRQRLVDGRRDRWVITQDSSAPQQLEDACR